MATRRYQIAMGAKEATIAESTPSAFGDNLVRIDIDFTAAMTRQLALEAIDEIKQRIIEGSWPPA
jgi:hypothetical protein